MSFRDNLLHLRAANNMTQEQLAMHLGVSRQAVTKWESEKSYPEMDKLIKMSQLFNCTLDELVQGDLTGRTEAPTGTAETSLPPADVFDYDRTMRTFAWKISTGVGAIILGTALSLPFYNANDPTVNPLFTLPENIGSASGFLCTCIGVIIGLALLISANMTRSHFVKEHPYIEDFYTNEEKAQARTSFTYQLVCGIACIFIGTFSTMLFGEDSENVFAPTILLVFVSIGVFLIIHGAMTLGRTNLSKYNQEAAEYLEEQEIKTAPLSEDKKQDLLQAKQVDKRIGAVCGTIMIVATLIALLLLFLPTATGNYGNSPSQAIFWLPWPIGGLLCGIAAILIKGFNKE